MPDSPTVDEEEVKAASVVEDDKTAEPSAATAESNKGSEQKSMLDAVKAALTGADKSPKSETQVPNAETVIDSEKEVDSFRKDFTDAEWKQLSSKTQRRMRDLADGSKALDVQVKELQPKAESFDRIAGLMRDNSLSQEEVDKGFDIMAAVKSQPERALELLAPLVRALLKVTGHELPEDLWEDVQAGRIPEARARELSTSRAKADLLGKQREQSDEQRRVDEETRQYRATVELSVKTADDWYKEKALKDPDWTLKQDRVAELVKLHVLETKTWPRTREDARKLFDEKLKIVEADIKKFRPNKQEVVPVNGDVSSRSKAVPKTMLEAMKHAVGQ
jgi:hypothetical protein